VWLLGLGVVMVYCAAEPFEHGFCCAYPKPRGSKMSRLEKASRGLPAALALS
jgi:hypothetical protein